jgi:hypothetical protein
LTTPPLLQFVISNPTFYNNTTVLITVTHPTATMAATCPALALFLTEYSPTVSHAGDDDPAPNSPTNSDEPAVPPAGSILLLKAALWELTRDSAALAATKMPEVHVEVVNDRRRIRLKSEESEDDVVSRGEMLGEGHASFYNFKTAMTKVAAEAFITEITVGVVHSV